MSRTIDELLTEALVHFDAATEYAQVTDRDPQAQPGLTAPAARAEEPDPSPRLPSLQERLQRPRG